MKRMVYILIAVTGLIVTGVLFAGCNINSADGSTKELAGLSFYRNHMEFSSCYSFYLREEDDKVLFDAEVRFEEEPYCIILESCEVDKSELERLRSLDEEYNFTGYVTTYKKKKPLFDVSDETMNKTMVFFTDGTDKSADTKEEHIDVLYNFFFQLANKYINESVYVCEE